MTRCTELDRAVRALASVPPIIAAKRGSRGPRQEYRRSSAQHSDRRYQRRIPEVFAEASDLSCGIRDEAFISKGVRHTYCWLNTFWARPPPKTQAQAQETNGVLIRRESRRRPDET
jgi:hypothetical protein